MIDVVVHARRCMGSGMGISWAFDCVRRVEQLRLLSKAEQAGLLSLAERAGLTLTFIERSGLLSKAESLGLLSLATDRCALPCQAMQHISKPQRYTTVAMLGNVKVCVKSW